MTIGNMQKVPAVYQARWREGEGGGRGSVRTLAHTVSSSCLCRLLGGTLVLPGLQMDTAGLGEVSKARASSHS